MDQAQIADLYRRYGPALHRRCLRLSGNEEDARELVQETFYQFCRSLDRFEGRSAPFTFLYRIATNVSIDRLRRRTTAGEQLPLEAERVAGVGATPDRQPLALRELARLTEGLDEETLTIAVMNHVDGLTQDEIAEALDLSRRTIGKKLKRFVEHTRKRMDLELADEAAGTAVDGEVSEAHEP